MKSVLSSTLKTGILVIDKPRGPSSHEVSAWVSKMLGVPVGHSGTLDPRVSGILVMMLGRASRLARILLADDKEYICLMRLHSDIDDSSVKKVLMEFTGRIYQRPPKKSAVKRKLRIRTINKIEFLDKDGRLVLFRVHCDAGTYIRSLCTHIGYALGTRAHMQELRRVRSGKFDETNAWSLQELMDATTLAKNENFLPISSMILPMDTISSNIASVVIRDTSVDAICNGAALAARGVIKKTNFKQRDLVGIITEKGEIVSIGEAIVDSSAFEPGDHGLVIAPRVTLMERGRYPSCWKKRPKTDLGRPARNRDKIKPFKARN